MCSRVGRSVGKLARPQIIESDEQLVLNGMFVCNIQTKFHYQRPQPAVLTKQDNTRARNTQISPCDLMLSPLRGRQQILMEDSKKWRESSSKHKRKRSLRVKEVLELHPIDKVALHIDVRSAHDLDRRKFELLNCSIIAGHDRDKSIIGELCIMWAGVAL